LKFDKIIESREDDLLAITNLNMALCLINIGKYEEAK
jgi:hypothetical protein